MRPMTGDNAFGRPRTTTRDDDVHLPMASSASSSHMSFVFADEASVDSYLDQSQTSARSFFRDPRKHRESTTSNVTRCDDKERGNRSRPTSQQQHPPSRDAASSAYSPISRHSAFTCSPASFSTFNQTELSRPITPIMLGPPMSFNSVISSPSSRRDSLGGSISEHALSEDLSEHVPSIRNTSTLAGISGAPQLVMPCIEMPTRRRFTETGKNIGRLKILLAGDSGTSKAARSCSAAVCKAWSLLLISLTGIGKTSLVKSIAQCCEHLVHVDPILPHPQLLRRHSGAVESEYLRPTTGVVEILASTKPYPEWWSELDVSSSSRRRSMGDSVLDRNICFVDTPGYGRGSSVSLPSCSPL